MSGTDLRNLVHIGAGALCVSLAWIPAPAAIALAAAAVAFNLWWLPGLAGGRLRRTEVAWGPSDRGLVLYPLSILVLLILLPDRPTLVAAAWSILALGDGAASLAGRRLGAPRLPWNPSKSVVGSAAFVACSGAAVSALLALSASGALPFRDGKLLGGAGSPAAPGWDASSCAWWVGIGLAAAAIAAALESLPCGLDDNLLVPWTSAAALLGLAAITPESLQEGLRAAARLWPSALALTLVVGMAAYLLRWVSLSGLASGVAIGTAIVLGLGWWGLGLLTAFFAAGSVATQAGLAAKQARGIAQEDSGARTSLHALANGAVPTLCALFALLGADRRACGLAFAAALGAATFDTVASEIGKWLGGPTYALERLERVPPGTPGGVSVAGTLSGALAAALLAALAWGGGLAPAGWAGALAVWIASGIGAFSERPLALLGSAGSAHPEALNLAGTLVGVAAALSAGRWLLPVAAAGALP